jgi:hypothetical protein
MRNYIYLGYLTVCFSFILNISHSQDKWCSYRGTFAGLFYDCDEVCGDTLIDGFVYDKIYTSTYDIQKFELISSYLRCYRRISGDSVLIKLKATGNNSQIRVFYRYNLMVNDTIKLDLGQGPFLNNTFKVIKIDTVELMGRNRKRIFLASNQNTKFEYFETWVEGIGSINTAYLLPGFSPFIKDASSFFSCCFDSKINSSFAPYDSLPCHLDEIQKHCSIISSINKIQENSIWIEYDKMYNPSILHLPFQKSVIKLVSIYGVILMNNKFHSESIPIESQNLVPGIYFIEIQSQNTKCSISFIKY